MQKLAVMGTSLFATEVVDLAEDTGLFEVACFIENWDREKTKQPFMGRPVIWIDDAASLVSTHLAVCSLGTTKRKGFILDVHELGFKFATIVHPTARVSKMSSVGEGSVISAGTIVASQTKIGRHVILNRGCLIGHDTIINDYVTVSPGANVAGVVNVGESSYIGLSATILDRINIGAGSLVGAGALVTKDVPDRVQVMGVPAKIVKENIDGH